MRSGITSGECNGEDVVNISEEAVPRWLNSPADTAIITVVIPTILCLALITNLTFLFVLYRIPKLRSDTNMYLAHLALADLLYVILASTIALWRYTSTLVAYHTPFLHSAQCTIFYTVVNTGYFASVALVTMVSFERYLALCHPIKHLKIRGRQHTNKMIGISWLVGLIFSGSTTFGVAVFNVQCLQWPDDDAYLDYPSKRGYCGPI